MPKKFTTIEYFRIIKENHRKYLEKNMVTHLERTTALEQAKLVDKYVARIGDYRATQEHYLNRILDRPSTAAKVGHGVLAGLLGIGVTGATYYAQQIMSPLDVINPLAGPKNMVAGVFSAALGAGASALAYKIWLASTLRVGDDDAYKEFEAQMKKVGFNDKKYEELSKKLVHLFHYRECLLLDLRDDTKQKMREDFKNKHFPDDKTFDDKALDTAIEVYFLAELNKLFNEAFVDIYDIHEEQIQKEKDQYAIINWLKKYFEAPEAREQFTQQLQIEFMNQCVDYLTSQMIEPSFVAKHPHLTASISGLIAGSIALGFAAIIIGGPITIGILAIGLVSACLAAVVTYFAINNIESLQFKRSEENRNALKHVRDDIVKESTRLKNLIKDVVPTTGKDLKKLEEYQSAGATKGFLNYFNIFNFHKKQVAMGASTAWIREHAIRYRHSKQIEIDLSEQHKGIIANGETQTVEMQRLLLEEMRAKVRGSLPAGLKNFIEDTKAYLIEPGNQDFIKRFELVEKIKQQVLEIVAAVPEGTLQTTLPKELIDFYTLSVADGGLGGLCQDLEQVRSLASIIDPKLATDELHPYYQMLVTAQRLNYALTQDPNKKSIFIGDADYRAMLGLRIENPSARIETKINAGNIQNYLNNSFDFLYSLNKPQKINGSTNLDTPFANTKEFVLYRALLIKQLAHLADPSNPHVDNEVRREIGKFARDKLYIDPKVVFDDVLHQGLFITEDKTSLHLKYLGREHSVSDLEYIADAIRLDLAYTSKPVTPRMMIAQEAVDFLFDRRGKTIFSYGKSARELPPEASTDYVEKIEDAIETTKAFMFALSERNTLKRTGALASYIHDCVREIKNLREQIAALDKEVPGKTAQGHRFKSPELANAEKSLKEYQEKLEIILDLRRIEELDPSNMMQSNIYFGGFAKPAINLDDWVKILNEQSDRSFNNNSIEEDQPDLTVSTFGKSAVMVNSSQEDQPDLTVSTFGKSAVMVNSFQEDQPDLTVSTFGKSAVMVNSSQEDQPDLTVSTFGKSAVMVDSSQEERPSAPSLKAVSVTIFSVFKPSRPSAPEGIVMYGPSAG
ncbi:hypothetical protein Lfee_1264 [Legionella feeleii]|uniref:Uncharacterized protein n=1 Tax=Legionella feeleii TaxID=453 RepID=A0A0W0TXQ4_9GAMM|nr:hypothetical protein [Legionella feeleii]KTD00188.1 hypothetical protein Lfee_1264 [Legionella feeleii]SPX60090.1 Uncharacterised protein [Legionella feeleii]